MKKYAMYLIVSCVISASYPNLFASSLGEDNKNDCSSKVPKVAASQETKYSTDAEIYKRMRATAKKTTYPEGNYLNRIKGFWAVSGGRAFIAE